MITPQDAVFIKVLFEGIAYGHYDVDMAFNRLIDYMQYQKDNKVDTIEK